MNVENSDVIVIGSGIAGLVCALSLAPRRVTLITKTDGLAGGSSWHAKGGIAAAIGPDDSPEEHAEDTLMAGAGLSDPQRALALAKDGIAGLHLLIDEGVPFDRARDGTLQLAREAAHKHARVVHAGGDATGEVLVSSLIRRLRTTPSVRILDNSFACDLLLDRGEVSGLIAVNPDSGWTLHRSSRVILATGGIGMSWWHTTNPKEACGDGLAMAARAGAKLTDLEFMQFHPTALVEQGNDQGASLPLLTEALRGAGALLLDEAGERFMRWEHSLAELAPRDVVARAIHKRTSSGENVYLDMRPLYASGKDGLFPQAVAAATAAGFDPQTDLLPVAPAAHYHMGGVQTDENGQTSLPGLWACGEVASTGVHGANRLASNSLLEGLVYAQRVADDIRRYPANGQGPSSLPVEPSIPLLDEPQLQDIVARARQTMTRYVGISRSADGLENALSILSGLDRELDNGDTSLTISGQSAYRAIVRWNEAKNTIVVARLVTLAALQRRESRGAHFRDDFPMTRPDWQRRQKFTFNMLRDNAPGNTDTAPLSLPQVIAHVPKRPLLSSAE